MSVPARPAAASRRGGEIAGQPSSRLLITPTPVEAPSRSGPPDRSVVGTAAIWLLVLAVVVPSGATAAPPAYKQAQDALERGDWRTAADHLERAIAEDPREKRGTLIRKRYIPHYLLGAVLFELGDCRGALRSLRVSEGQGVIQRMDEMGSLRRVTETCTQRITDSERSSARIETALDKGRALERRIRDFESDPHLTQIWQELAPRLEEPLAALALAGRRLEVAAAALAIGEIEALSADVSAINEELRAIESQLIERRAEHDREIAELIEERRKLVERAMGTLNSAAEDVRSTSAWASGRQCVLGQVANEPGVDPAADELQAMIDTLQRCLRRLRSVKPPVPPELLRAAESLLAGNYDAVIETLTDADDSRARGEAHASLLLAAARWALARIQPEAREELEAAAREDVLACRRAAPRLNPPPELFSPPFVEFFNAQQESPEGE